MNKTRPLSELKNWEENPRSISKDGFDRLIRQVVKLGPYKESIVMPDGTTLGGNMRLRVYQHIAQMTISDMRTLLSKMGYDVPDDVAQKIIDRVKNVPVSEIDFVERDGKFHAVVNGEEQIASYPTVRDGMMEYALSDNDRAGYYDDDLLANLLPTFEIDFALYAVDMREPTNLKKLHDIALGAHEDQAPEVDNVNPPKSVLGEVYQLGEHRIMCGDSTSYAHVEKLMNGRKAQMIFTDPPYMVDYHSPGGLTYDSKKYGGTGTIFNDNLDEAQATQFFIDVLTNLYAFSEDKATLYWWFANKQMLINRIAWEETGWHFSQVIIWLKNSMVFSRGQDYHRMYEPCMLGWKKKKSHYKSKNVQKFTDVFNLDYDDFELLLDVWYQKRDNTADYVHPTQKPVRLAERALKKNSRIGELVIDLFGGSGSTLMACHQMQRVCYAMELDPKYVDVIRKRYANFIGRGESWEEATPAVE